LSKCQNYFGKNHVDDISPGKDSIENLAKAFAHVWLSMMKNATIATSDGEFICDSEFKISSQGGFSGYGITVEEELFLQYPPPPRAIRIPVEMMTLKFVSCGRHQASGFAFLKLIKVFDRHVWLCVGFTLLILMFVMEQFVTTIRPTSKLLRHWVYLVKVLLEQNDPFPENIMEKSN